MYPSDLTDVQWGKLEPLLNKPVGERHAGGRPRKHERRRIVDALLYVVRTGCQWRQLPADFPPWKSVHEQFRAWRDSGVWERVTKTLRQQGRQAQGRNASPTVAIIDSQSAKTALKGRDAPEVPSFRLGNSSSLEFRLDQCVSSGMPRECVACPRLFVGCMLGHCVRGGKINRDTAG
jgi:transposase